MSSSSDSTVTTRHDDCNNTDDPFSQSDLTQTISDSQFNDDDMYRIIQSKFGIDWIFSLKLCFSSRIVASTKELLGLMPLLVSLLTTSCMLLSSLSFCVLVFRPNKGINPNNSFVLATILELKQSFNENIQSIGDKLETLSKKFEDENKMICLY
jgi:hypothetical protein